MGIVNFNSLRVQTSTKAEKDVLVLSHISQLMRLSLHCNATIAVIYHHPWLFHVKIMTKRALRVSQQMTDYQIKAEIVLFEGNMLPLLSSVKRPWWTNV